MQKAIPQKLLSGSRTQFFRNRIFLWRQWGPSITVPPLNDAIEQYGGRAG